METPLSPTGRSSFNAAGAFLKYVIQPGVLQDKTGPCVVTEFAPLLPGMHADHGGGFSWSGIVSQRWGFGTAHFNLDANLTRDRRAETFLGIILEGPAKWTVRPVAEFFL